MKNYIESDGKIPEKMERYDVWHSGFAWACTREAWDALGGLIDFAILRFCRSIYGLWINWTNETSISIQYY